jgi:hypothetical protein
MLSFRDGKSDDEDDDDDDCDGFNGDSGDFPSLENSGKTSPSSGEYTTDGAVNLLTLCQNLVIVRNAKCPMNDRTCSNFAGHYKVYCTGRQKKLLIE